MSHQLLLESAGVSDIGKQRQYNEDALVMNDELGLYAVADGMGGHIHGDVASRVTIDTLLDEVAIHLGHNTGNLNQDICYVTIANAIEACNKLVLQKNVENNCKVGEGMGTTLVGTYFLRHSMQTLLFNVGDSRIYRFRDGGLKQITRDHTMYQQWIDTGRQGAAPSKNVLVSAIGVVEELSPDISLENVLSDDVYIVCSDGLSGLVDDESLQEYMKENYELPILTICTQLIELANENGGSDNITVIIIRAARQSNDIPVAEVDLEATIQRI